MSQSIAFNDKVLKQVLKLMESVVYDALFYLINCGKTKFELNLIKGTETHCLRYLLATKQVNKQYRCGKHFGGALHAILVPASCQLQVFGDKFNGPFTRSNFRWF